MKYTVEMHGKRLLRMMEKKNPCQYCPATPHYSPEKSPAELYENNPCFICNSFVDMPSNEKDRSCCPCLYYRKDVIKRTWIALEEKGFI